MIVPLLVSQAEWPFDLLVSYFYIVESTWNEESVFWPRSILTRRHLIYPICITTYKSLNDTVLRTAAARTIEQGHASSVGNDYMY